jgi:predicted nucleic acid-binding protein
MVLVDSNVLLDLFSNDPQWFAWSQGALAQHGIRDRLAINPLIYAELAPGFPSRQALDERIEDMSLIRLPLPYEAGFLAGKAFVKYRRRGGAKSSPLPDFYIGAHAESHSAHGRTG